MKPKIAINGFGRIGRQIFRINLEKNYFDIVAINDLGDAKTMAHLLKHDSNYGTLKEDVHTEGEDYIIVDGKKHKVLTEKDPAKLPWKDLDVDVVIEATGVFRTKELASLHITAGAKKVVLTAPAKSEIDFTTVIGVNDSDYDADNHVIISNASCTTNCLAPVAKVLNDTVGIERGMMTTVHSYTNDQRILDLPHKDLRRARSAGQSIIPTTTGAAKAVAQVIPELKGKLEGLAIRVPTPTVSLVDFVFQSKKETSAEEVNEILKKASEGSHKGIIAFSESPLVSVDFRGNEHSSIVDGLSTMATGTNMIKVMSWYDNEWGYSCRTVDLVKMVGESVK